MASHKKIDKERVFWVVLIIAIGMGGVIYNNYLDRLPQHYTIGTIYKLYQPPKGNPVAAFRYEIAGKEYKSSIDYYGYEQLAKSGATFLVEYPVYHEGAGLLLFENPVPPNTTPPLLGWESKPTFY